MKISTKARYAVMAMLELTMNDKQGPLNLTEISQAQGISLSYLEQLFASLRKEGLVKGRRGPGGGYRLGHPANEISVADVIRAVNDNKSLTKTTQSDYAPANLWDQLSDRLMGFLEDISLAESVNSAQRAAISDPSNVTRIVEHTLPRAV